MFDKLGSRKYVVPLLVAVVIGCVMSLMFYPMANMDIQGLPFAALSLDEGVDTPQGTVNAGEAIVESMTTAADDEDGTESPITWKQVGSQEELDAALENGEFYGAIIVPESFSADQAAAKQAEAQAALAQAQALAAAQAAAAASQGGLPDASVAAGAGAGAQGAGAASPVADVQAPAIKVVIDNAKSPLVASQMKANIASMFQQLGVEVDVQTIHTGDDGSSEDGAAAANPMAGMLSQQLTISPLIIMSLVGAIVLSRVFKTKAGVSKAERWKSLGVQVAYAVVVSLIASLCVYCMLLWVAGIETPMANVVLFMWFASFCVMLLFIGAFNLSFPVGILVAACVVLGGMMCGVLPYEGLPTFWQDWVYLWAPQRFTAEGLRAVMYLDAGVWNAGSLPLLITGGVGVAAATFAGLVPAKQRGAKAAS